jgi:hypothetical protein
MKYCALAVWLAATICTLPAFAINKCTLPDGKVTFQDAPCSSGKTEILDVQPASGRAPSNAGTGARAQTEAARLEGIISASQRDRRALELRERLIPDAERALAQHRVSCAERQTKLSEQQYIYRQNLYGKTHAAQIASEMAAAAATCDTKDRELKDSVDALTKECVALKCRS